MNNGYDTKLIIRMVAVIGALCLFVGIATRIRQNSQVTLADIPKAKPKEASESIITEDNDGASSKLTKEDSDGASSKLTTEDSGDASSELATDVVADTGSKQDTSTNSVSDMTEYEYHNFFYIIEEDKARLHILYYDSNHNVTTAELFCDPEKADETLKLYYDLYKAGHDFSDISQLSKYCD